MTIKYQPVFLAIVCSAVLLSGCAFDKKNQPPDDATKICENLRAEIIANNYVNNPPDEQGNSPTTAAQLYKDYARHNCSELIEPNKDNPLPPSYKSGGILIPLTNQS